MQNIFDVDKNANNNINRNPYDWRHTNHFSCRLGYYYPLLSKLVPPNTKLKIKADLGLQFDPMSFPVQTPFKARMSFFKVPLRILWKDYKDYIGNFRDDLEEPFHDIPDAEFENFYATSKLADYLDLPTTIYTNDNSLSPIYERQAVLDNYFFVNSGRLDPYSVGSSIYNNNQNITDYSEPWYIHRLIGYRQPDVSGATRLIPGSTYNLNFDDFPTKLTLNLGSNDLSQSFSYSMDFIALIVDKGGVIRQVIDYDKDNKPFFRGRSFSTSNTFGYNVESWTQGFQFVASPDLNPSEAVRIVFAFILRIRNLDFPAINVLRNLQTDVVLEELDQFPTNLSCYIDGQLGYGTFAPLTLANSPIYSSESNPDGKKLSCYRSRAYECIYNSYFRDQRNNPLYDNEGKPVYNKWLLNYDGGADRTVYKLRKCNWEKDFLTTALPSPQQGNTPLVGLTQYITEVPNPDGSNLTSYQLALVDEQGKKYKVTYKVDGDGVNGYTIGVDGVLPDDTPVASIDYNKMMLNNINYGISIPDFRVVNSYQRYLELNMLKGFSYKDIIEGRFDCKVRFDELLMPEFIGGFTRDINMNRVVQSVDVNSLSGAQTDTYKGALGSLSGDAFLSTNGQTPDISVFCDEECLILGIMSIVPQPAYSQLIPKDYFYRDVLDHFNPEFDNLGYQPISYAEVCLLQCAAFNVNPDDTFGYQRPWYEYVSQPDTVHGLLRTTKRDFIMNRNFNTVPMLTESFLLVDDRQLNDVFQANTGEDPIVGQCFFDITAELPISRRTQRRIE